MSRYWKMLTVLLLGLCLCGCGKKPLQQPTVVMQVDILAENGNKTLHRRYTQPEKVRQVLNYLRLQESLGTARIDPERLVGSVYKIDVLLSDGSHSIYYQRSNRYLSKKYHPWQKIDPQKAAEFYGILLTTPTDL